MEIRSQIQTFEEEFRIISSLKSMYSLAIQGMGGADADLKDQLKTLVPRHQYLEFVRAMNTRVELLRVWPSNLLKLCENIKHKFTVWTQQGKANFT